VKTDGLITSELILIEDYRTLGLSNPRIIDTLPVLFVPLSTFCTTTFLFQRLALIFLFLRCCWPTF